MAKRSNRIQRTDATRDNPRISKTEPGQEKKIVFSFKRLYKPDKKFCYDKCKTKYFLHLLSRLRDVSGMTRNQMMFEGGRGKSGLRCHKISFNDRNGPKTSESSFGLGQAVPEADDDAWQFKLSNSRYGRVHGYFVDNEFYIVWLDPEHKLYPGKKLEHR